MNELFTRVNRRYATVCSYIVATIVLGYGGCMLLKTISPVFAMVFNLVATVLEPMIYGAALSYVFSPLVAYVGKKLQRVRHFDDEASLHSAAVIATLLLIALFIAIIFIVFILMITHSVSAISFSTIQEILDDAQGNLLGLVQSVESLLTEWGLVSSSDTSSIISMFNDVSSMASTMVFSAVFFVYFLFDGAHVTAYFARLARVVMGERNIDPTPVLADLDRVFSGYFRGQALDALVVGISSGIVLTIVAVPYAPVVGVLAGLGNLIPYLGGPIGFGSIILLCLAEGAWGKLVAGCIAMAVIMFVDGNIINPRLLSNTVQVHPILVMASLIAGGAIGGLAGMLVAVPIAAFLKIQLDRWMEHREAENAEAPDEMTEAD